MIRIRSLLAAGAIAGLAAFSFAAPAMASDNGKAGLYAANYQCGGATNLAQGAGFIIAHAAADGSLSINYHLQDAAPNNTYDVWLYQGNCTYTAFLGQVTTNSNGEGNANFQGVTGVVAGNSVFTVSYDVAPYNGSFAESAEVTP